MSSQHAPGRWYVFEGYDDENPEYTIETSVTIAYIRPGTFNPNPKATANLMAAAPDLLDVTKGFRRKLETYVSVYPGDKELRRLLADCDAAIAKAEGEQHG